MRTTSTKLQPLTVIALAACAALPAQRATAQSQDTRPCTAIEDDRDRLACYDRALRPAPARPSAPAATAAPAAAPPAASPATATATENRATRREREVREATAKAAPAAPAPAAAPAPPAAQRATKAGKPSPEVEAMIPVVVVQVRAVPGRAATFVTDAGDSWVQIDSQRWKVPDVPFKAVLKPGAMSSYFLVPDEYARSIRVRRGY